MVGGGWWEDEAQGVPPLKNQMGAFCYGGAGAAASLGDSLAYPGALSPATNTCPSTCDFQMNKPILVATGRSGNP